ncbi:hypothetical protein FSP39_020214 [Pinctada imbricata]|uniref:Neurotransmitter-gated ion-channel ligand-binding domain-containing protein n=1 Tax=Pinctada imbricata TaxID=66713 RepID=A0AA88Y086_PINIB|nr:hypothetical protein FSP39_020214 [Pinctada imbricata]
MDQSLSWDPNDYGGLTRVKVQANNLWMPNIGIGNAAENGEVLNPDFIGMFLRVHHDGRVAIRYSGTMRTMCTPNAYYYPFDFHTCPVALVVFGYDKTEIKLRAKGYKENDQAFLRHAEWLVKLGKVGKVFSFYPTVSIDVHLQRRPGYIFLTTILPLLMLVLLQVLVFLLPVESGERISYSITMFLSYAVFMTIVTEKMPPSDPVSLMSHFLTFLLANGALILIANVCILGIYYKRNSDDIPRCLRGMTSCILRKNKGHKNVVDVDPMDIKEQRKEAEAMGIENVDMIYCLDSPKQFLPDTMMYPLPQDIRWRMVARALDIVCFIFFISDLVVFIIFFYFLQYDY